MIKKQYVKNINGVSILLYFHLFSILTAQTLVSNNWDETGLLDIQNYGPAEYRAAPVNHDVIIDNRNIVLTL